MSTLLCTRSLRQHQSAYAIHIASPFFVLFVSLCMNLQVGKPITAEG
jgi:hypothetical protein